MTKTFEISEEFLDMVTEALTELPYRRVQPIFDVMTQEIGPQLQEQESKIYTAH